MRWRILIAVAGCCVLAALPARALETACREAMRARLNLGIGLYRTELSAIHLVDELEGGHPTAPRRAQLERARDEVIALMGSLKSRTGEMVGDTGLSAACPADADRAVARRIHQSLEDYMRTVEARVIFMEHRLGPTGRTGGPVRRADPTDLGLAVREALTRYGMWRAFALAVNPQGTTARELYVVGMLTRFEWNVAVAVETAFRHAEAPGKSPGASGKSPQASLADAAESAETLKRTWPPRADTATPLWGSLQAVASALPDTRRTPVPAAEPAGGWTRWAAAWTRDYDLAFAKNASRLLKAMENQGLD